MMNFPKAMMTVSELMEMGFTKTQLYQAAHHKLSSRYITYTPGGGKIIFNTEAFSEVMQEVLR